MLARGIGWKLKPGRAALGDRRQHIAPQDWRLSNDGDYAVYRKSRAVRGGK